MRVILRTNMVTEAESLRIALDAVGIRALVRSEPLNGIGGSACSVSVIDDTEYERARAILSKLEESPKDG